MRTLLGLPTYDGNINIRTAFAASSSGADIAFSQDSMLTRCFNRLWVQALELRKRDFTHFCMLHADIVPGEGFLDKMHKIMAGTGADVLSVISPLKNADGLTSTALENEEDSWRCSRFTMRQLQTMPDTFTHPRLLLNTGLMLVDMRKGWVEQMYFRTEDTIEDGRVLSLTEDYLFSMDARERGAKLVATRAVGLEHVGTASYTNVGGWGLRELDKVPAIWEK